METVLTLQGREDAAAAAEFARAMEAWRATQFSRGGPLVPPVCNQGPQEVKAGSIKYAPEGRDVLSRARGGIVNVVSRVADWLFDRSATCADLRREVVSLSDGQEALLEAIGELNEQLVAAERERDGLARELVMERMRVRELELEKSSKLQAPSAKEAPGLKPQRVTVERVLRTVDQEWAAFALRSVRLQVKAECPVCGGNGWGVGPGGSGPVVRCARCLGSGQVASEGAGLVTQIPRSEAPRGMADGPRQAVAPTRGQPAELSSAGTAAEGEFTGLPDNVWEDYRVEPDPVPGGDFEEGGNG